MPTASSWVNALPSTRSSTLRSPGPVITGAAAVGGVVVAGAGAGGGVGVTGAGAGVVVGGGGGVAGVCASLSVTAAKRHGTSATPARDIRMQRLPFPNTARAVSVTRLISVHENNTLPRGERLTRPPTRCVVSVD